MLLSIGHEELSSALEKVKRTIGKPSLPASTCIHMEVEQQYGTVRLHASDGAFHTLMSIPAKAISQGGEALVDASLFSGLVKTYDSDIQIGSVDLGIALKFKRNQNKVPGMDPKMRITEPVTGVSQQWSIDPKDLKAVVDAIEYARLKKNGNVLFQDFGLKIENGEATFLSADGHRVAMAKLSASGLPDMDVMIPAKALHDVIALSADHKTPMKVEFFPNIIKFDMGDITYYAPYVTTKFPAFNKHIVRRGNCFSVNRAELTKALTRAELITTRADGKTTDVMPGVITISVQANELLISGASPSGALVDEELDVTNPNGIQDTVKVYARFLLEAVKRVTTENVELDIDSSVKRPLLVFDDNNNDAGHLIMPIRPDNPPPPVTKEETPDDNEQPSEPTDAGDTE